MIVSILATNGHWKLSIGDDGDHDDLVEDIDPLHLPSGVARLEKLACIEMFRCQSFPVELDSMLNLQQLWLFE